MPTEERLSLLRASTQINNGAEIQQNTEYKEVEYVLLTINK